MSGVFLDSNILIYAYSRDDPRMARAQALVSGGGTISVQCLNEFASIARRKLAMPWPELYEALDIVRTFCARIVPLDTRLHIAGLDVAERYRLSIYDGLIVAGALLADCSTLYSEDMHHGLVIDDRLTVFNPFRE